MKELCQTLKETQSRALGAFRPEGTPGTHVCRRSKPTLEADIEAFLYAFEAITTVARWPPAHWVTILGPYLTGPAQVVMKMMPTQDITDYAPVKVAIWTTMR